MQAGEARGTVKRLTLIASLVLICGTAAASGQTVNTKLDWQGAGRSCVDGHCTASGEVLVVSKKQACVDNRQVNFVAVYKNGSKRKFDTDRATPEGYAGGYGTVKNDPLDKILFKAPTAEAGGVKCRKARFAFRFPDFRSSGG